MTRALELVTIGEAFEDLIFSGLARLPRLGEELRVKKLVRTYGGGVVITAVAAARLGLRCGILSALSDDAAYFLQREKIAVSNLRRRNEQHAVTAALSTPEDRSFVTFNGVNDQLSERLLSSLKRLPQARHLHFALSPKRCADWLPAVKRAKGQGLTTSWDFGWNEAFNDDPAFPELMAAVDVLFVNELEARLYTGAASLPSAATTLLQRNRLTILKLGPKGARWLSKDTDISESPMKVEVLDTTGAGDAFNGGFLCGWLRGEPPRNCLKLGNVMGALSTRAAGGIDGLPRRSELP